MSIPLGFCQCGCGEPTTVCNRNHARLGYVKGQPFRFIRNHSTRVSRRADVYKTKRVSGSKHGSVLEHVLIAEKALGRPLPDGVQVHHVDENRRNNANTNLVICPDQSYHLMLHARAKTFRAGGNPNTEHVCGICGIVKPLDQFNKQAKNRGRGLNSQCRQCQSNYFKSWQQRAAAREEVTA